MSTGMSTIAEIVDAANVLISGGTEREKITVLHCNTEYPTPFDDVNLNAMKTIADFTKLNVGYSDHTLGIEVPIAAVSLGAKILEKHFTLDRTLDGPDHVASLEPQELRTMVQCIRNIEKAMGNGEKKPSPSEQKNMVVARKSIHYSKDLKLGHILELSDFVMKRPGSGISPMAYKSYEGRELKNNVAEDDLLKDGDFI